MWSERSRGRDRAIVRRLGAYRHTHEREWRKVIQEKEEMYSWLASY